MYFYFNPINRIKIWILYLLSYYYINHFISACDNDVNKKKKKELCQVNLKVSMAKGLVWAVPDPEKVTTIYVYFQSLFIFINREKKNPLLFFSHRKKI